MKLTFLRSLDSVYKALKHSNMSTTPGSTASWQLTRPHSTAPLGAPFVGPMSGKLNESSVRQSLICLSVLSICRPLLAEVFEERRRFDEACEFAQCELECDDYNCSYTSKIRARVVLGRCHAALGQHAQAVAVFDEALVSGLLYDAWRAQIDSNANHHQEAAQVGQYLISAALVVKARVAAAAGRHESSEGLYWDAHTGQTRLAEAMAQLVGSKEAGAPKLPTCGRY